MLDLHIPTKMIPTKKSPTAGDLTAPLHRPAGAKQTGPSNRLEPRLVLPPNALLSNGPGGLGLRGLAMVHGNQKPLDLGCIKSYS